MRLSTIAILATTALAQTFTDCNPLKQSCKPDPALGGAENFDFTNGALNDWTVTFKPHRVTYDARGAELTVAEQGDNPTIQSDFFFMFGRVEAVLQAAPGVGIVSSFVLQSDDLDEIDLEWLGGDNTQVQTNFFVKGNTDTYDRGAFHPIANPTGELHTYAIEWTQEQITWFIDGAPIRTLLATDYHGFPQSPMQIRIGIWAGGDPTNNPGTIQWAGGETNYQTGPYSMVIKSVNVEDYSTGHEYYYSDMSGTWQSIKSNGGEIRGIRPAVIAPAGNHHLDVISGSDGPSSSSSAAVPASSAPVSSTASSAAASTPESSTSSIAPATSSSTSSTAAASTTKSSTAPAPSKAPEQTVDGSLGSVIPVLPVANTTSIPAPAASNTTTLVVVPSTTASANVTVSLTKAFNTTTTVTTEVCSDSKCHESKTLTSTKATVVPVESKSQSASSAPASSAPSATQAPTTTSATQANSGMVNGVSVSAAIIAFAALLI